MSGLRPIGEVILNMFKERRAELLAALRDDEETMPLHTWRAKTQALAVIEAAIARIHTK